MYAITLHQPWASLIALGIKTVETRSLPAPALLVGQTIVIHAGKQVVKKPGVAVENELRARLGEDWHRTSRRARCWPPQPWPAWPELSLSTRAPVWWYMTFPPRPGAPWVWGRLESTLGATTVPVASYGFSTT